MEMKASELEKVINACGKNGVSHIKIGDIDITFNGFVKVLETDYPKMVDNAENIVVADPNFKFQEDLERGLMDDDQKMILDPAGYEDDVFKKQVEEQE